MVGHFSQEVDFCTAPYFFSLLSIAGFRLLTMARNSLGVDRLGAHIVVHCLVEVHISAFTHGLNNGTCGDSLVIDEKLVPILRKGGSY